VHEQGDWLLLCANKMQERDLQNHAAAEGDRRQSRLVMLVSVVHLCTNNESGCVCCMHKMQKATITWIALYFSMRIIHDADAISCNRAGVGRSFIEDDRDLHHRGLPRRAAQVA
jgi:hypothetical protein